MMLLMLLVVLRFSHPGCGHQSVTIDTLQRMMHFCEHANDDGDACRCRWPRRCLPPRARRANHGHEDPGCETRLWQVNVRKAVPGIYDWEQISQGDALRSFTVVRTAGFAVVGRIRTWRGGDNG
ncbi:hypothetical protein B0H19DRAFT_1085460 [Mycena capillaripes]|nr:hypothetical protein B0H19DRAFT_1085460 [Mycena capillaripes]